MDGIIQRSSRFTTGQDMKLTKRQQEILNQIIDYEYQDSFNDFHTTNEYLDELKQLAYLLKESNDIEIHEVDYERRK